MLVESTVIAADAVISMSPNYSCTDPATGDPVSDGLIPASTLPRGGLIHTHLVPVNSSSSSNDF